MLKYYIHINKGLMEGKPVFTPIDQDKLSFEGEVKALKVVNLIVQKYVEK